MFGGAIAGWLAGLSLPLIAIAAGALMIAIAQRDPAEAFARVEWSLLLFFAPGVESLTDAAAGRLGGAPGATPASPARPCSR